MKRKILVTGMLAISGSLFGNNEGIKLEDSIITSDQGFEQNIFQVSKNITVITNEEIKAKGAKNVAEALIGVPNLAVKSLSGSDYKFDLRGQGEGSFSNVIVALDGVPMNSIDLSGYRTSQIPVDNIERIEVVPSGGSVLYGDGAVGGIINIISKNPEDKKIYGEVGLEAGSNNLLKSTMNYGGKIGKKTFLNLNYMGQEFDGYRDDSRDDFKTFNLNLRQLIDKGYIDFKYMYSKSDFRAQGPVIGKENSENDPTQIGGWVTEGKNKYNTYTLNYKQGYFNDKLEFLLNTQYKNQKYRSTSWGYDTDTLYLKPQLKYNYVKDSYVIFGGDLQSGETKVLKRDGKVKKDSLGAFVINKTTIGNFEFQQGYRRQDLKYDIRKNKQDFVEDAVELTGTYLIEDGSIYLSYNTAFRTPNTDELNFWDGEYKPQTSNTIELGAKKFKWDTYFTGSIFRTSSDNEIVYAEIDNSIKANRNLDGKSERLGMELSAEKYFSKLYIKGAFGYLGHEIKSGTYQGKEIPGVPNITGNILASYTLTDKITLNGNINYFGKSYYFTDFKNTGEKQDDYITTDTNIRYKVSETLTVYAGINNLFDEKYALYAQDKGNDFTSLEDKRAFYPAPGRNYYAGFKSKF